MPGVSEVLSMAMHTAMEVTAQAHTEGSAPTTNTHNNNLATRDPSGDSSTVMDAGGGPPPRDGSAAGEARGNDVGTTGYDDPLKALESDPDYLELTAKEARLLQALSDLSLVDSYVGGNQGDGEVWMRDLKAAMEQGPSAVQDAAARFLADPEIRVLIDANHDNSFTLAEVYSALNTVRDDIKKLRDSAKSSRTGGAGNTDSGGGTGGTDSSGGTAGSGSTGGTSGTDNAAASPADWKFNEADLTVRPFASTATDAGNLLADSLGHVQGEVERLTKLKAQALAAGKPEDAAKIDAQLNKLNMCLQMLTASMQQQQQMMSNIAKMWSDMAMNSIRNMK